MRAEGKRAYWGIVAPVMPAGLRAEQSPGPKGPASLGALMS